MATRTATASKLRHLFEVVFSVQPDEFRRVQAFFVYSLLVGMFHTVSETVGDALFLSRLERQEAERLFAWLYVGTAVGSVAATAFYGFIAARVARLRLLVASHLVLAATVIAFRYAILLESRWVYFAMNVWLEACAILMVALFFSFSNDYFTSRDARRLYAYIGAGSALGSLVGGYGIEPLVRMAGSNNLLYTCAALLAGGAGMAAWIATIAEPVHVRDSQAGDAPAPLRSIASSRYLRFIGLMVIVGWVAQIVVDYVLKIQASREMGEQELEIFLGKFSGYGGVAELLVEVVCVGVLLRRAGVINSMLVLPALQVVSGLGYVASPTLLMAAVSNFMPTMLSESLDLPARELLFLPLPSRIRATVQGLMDGMLVPVGYGIGGLVVVVLISVVTEIRYLAPVAIGAALLWIVLILLVRPRYEEALVSSLRNHRFTPADLDTLLHRGESDRVLGEILAAGTPEGVLSTLELLKERPLGAFGRPVSELASSPEEAVAVRVLQLLAADRVRDHLPAIRRALADPRSAVRCAAVLALCAVVREDAVAEIGPYLDSADPDLRRAALVGLARDGEFEGALLAYPRLEGLRRSQRVDDRVEAATTLGAIGGHHTVRVLQHLLGDPEPLVRRAALVAARRIAHPAVVPQLLRLLDDLWLRPLAVQTLEVMPREAVPAIADAARDGTFGASVEDAPFHVFPSQRCALVWVLRRIGGRAAARALWDLVAPDDSVALRLAAAQALRQLRAKKGIRELSLPGLDDRRDQLCEEIGGLRRVLVEEGARDLPGRLLLVDHARLQQELLLCLLALKDSRRRLEDVEARLFGEDEAARANALELLEVVLPRAIARRVVGVLDEQAAPAPGSQSAFASDARPDRPGSEPWVRVITRYSFPGSILRQPGTSGGHDMRPEDVKLYRVVSTVSILKQVALFHDVPADYLAGVAEIAAERTMYPDETLFRQGEIGDALYLICEGRIRVTVDGAEVAELGPSECIGEMALLDGQPRSATATVVEETRLLRISDSDFRDLLTSQPVIVKALLQTLARRLRNTMTHAHTDALPVVTVGVTPEPNVLRRA